MGEDLEELHQRTGKKAVLVLFFFFIDLFANLFVFEPRIRGLKSGRLRKREETYKFARAVGAFEKHVETALLSHGFVYMLL